MTANRVFAPITLVAELKNVVVIHPSIPAAGGIVDPMTRTVSQKVGENIGHAFVIEHRPGSGGTIAAAYAKQQPPDGYTLFLGSAGTHAANKAMNPKLPYDPIIRKLYEEFAKGLRSPEVSGMLNKMELAPPLVTQEQFVQILASDIDRFAKVIKEVGAKAN